MLCLRPVLRAKPRGRPGKPRRPPAALIDDFPRELTEFEKLKIRRMMRESVDLVASTESANPEPVQEAPSTPVPDNIDLILANLGKWDVCLAASSLRGALGNASDDTKSAVKNDARLLSFINRVFQSDNWSQTLASGTMLDILSVTSTLDSGSAKSNMLLKELVLARQLEGLTMDQINQIAEAANLHKDVSVQDALLNHAIDRLNIPSLLLMVPHGLSQGRFIIPPSLIPALNKSDLIRVLGMMQRCEFPSVIAETLTIVADELARLSFHRLVSESEKDELLKTLFAIKVKLDSMVFIDGNLFYSKGKANYLGKILKVLTNEFHESAVSLPIDTVSRKMIALLALNKLRLESMDLVANRISAFGNKLLIPATLNGSQFTCLTYALTNHPLSWKRVDKYRNSIARPLAHALRLQLESNQLNPSQIVSCSRSIMSIHNRDVRGVVNQALMLLDPLKLSTVEQIASARLMATLLNHDDSASRIGVEPFLRLVANIDILRLRTPQLVELLETCRSVSVVHRVEEIASALENRLETGSISPTNAVRAVVALGMLQTRGVASLVSTLAAECVSVLEGPRPLLIARLVSGIAACSIANPEIAAIAHSSIEQLLLNVSSPDQLVELRTQPRIACDFTKSLLVLGDLGASYKQHLAALPAPVEDREITAIRGAELTQRSILDDLISLTIKPHVSKEEWEGLLPLSTSFAGDLLGALMPHDPLNDSAESGGFTLSTPRVWRNGSEKIQISIVRSKQCARDNPRHILGAAASAIATDRAAGWQVIVLPEDMLLRAQSEGVDSVKRKVRRARIIHKDAGNRYDVLLRQFRELLS